LAAVAWREVYRARDTRLDRTVAIKVLPEHLAEDPERKQRFEREARAISQLNHPHICSLYDVGEQDGIHYLVMEHIKGVTLADRLKKGALAFEQAIEYGVQIAEALDRAHRARIVHRDLKPGNVMLTDSGVKLLDFGLAKPIPHLGGELESERQTEERDLTAAHAIVGTLRYMAPEQLERKPLDARTDIFAFGVVLYEMVTGRHAFDGRSPASLMSAILTSIPPPLSESQPRSSAHLDRTLRKCLEKDPEMRWQSARDLMDELRWLREHAPGASRPVGKTRQQPVLWLVAGALLAALLISVFRDSTLRAKVVQSSILPPAGTSFTRSFALSPDGTRLAFVARADGGKEMLWVRALGGLAAQPLAGTETASSPFWSPDGLELAFFARGKLMVTSASGGPVQAIADAPNHRGGAWGAKGRVVFAPTFASGLHIVSAHGGVVAPLTALDADRREISHRWPTFVANEGYVLFSAQTTQSGGENDRSTIDLLRLDSGERTALLEANSSALYAPGGYVLYWRQGALVAQQLDLGRKVLGPDFLPVAQRVGFTESEQAVVTISAEGTLAYQLEEELDWSQLAWLDRSGRLLEAMDPLGSFVGGISLSHDGSELAFVQFDPQTSGRDIWIQNVERRTVTRLTFGRGDEVGPVWSRDGTELLYRSSPTALAEQLVRKPVSGLGGEEKILEWGGTVFSLDWSPDGRSIVVAQGSVDTSADLWIHSLSGADPKPLVQLPFDQMYAVYSPNGDWIAYQSNESGEFQVYVQPASGGSGRWQLSTEGGLYPRWNREGTELFFIAPPNRMMVVPVSVDDGFQVGVPRLLFEASLPLSGEAPYDVTPDGERFVVELQRNAASPITLVTNWTALLERE
jgi:Tol biopolymer transport system component